MQLHRRVDHALRAFGRHQLGHGRLAGDGLALVAQPGGAVDEQRAGVHLAGHVGQLGLRERQIGQASAEHGAGLRMLHALLQRAPRKAECSGGHRSTEHVERAHRHLEALARRADHLAARHSAAVEAQARQRMRRDHLDALGNFQPGVVRIDDEGADAARTGRFAGAGKHDVEIGNAAV